MMTITNMSKLSFAVFFAALAIVFIAALSLLTPTVTYEAELEGREHACTAGGELQGGQCVTEPLVACPEGYVVPPSEEDNDIQCGKVIAQESPVCPEGSTDIDETEARIVCIDDRTGERVIPECTTEGAILQIEFQTENSGYVCNIYGDFTGDRIIVGCNEGFTLNEEGQCVNRPGRSDLHTER